MILRVEKLSARYGSIQGLQDASLEVAVGDICLIFGENGSGKSTFLKCVCGLVPPIAGQVFVNGIDVTGKPPWWHLRGEQTQVRMALVLQGRRLFASLTVAENLATGAHLVNDHRIVAGRLERVLDLFPALRAKMRVAAALLSGGEQQQVALGRGMMTGANLLLLDEPTLGLDLDTRARIFEAIRKLNAENVTVLMVEHNVEQALPICNRSYRFLVGRTCEPVDRSGAISIAKNGGHQ